MPKVDFHVLASESSQERYRYACKLIEKAYRSGVFAYVLTDSPEQSQQLDDLIWTFRAGSFVPHQVYKGELPSIDNVILIGNENPPERWQATVINLSSRLPNNFLQSERILEILDDSEETKAWGRQRYKQYQQAGIEITTHKM